jgi:hypothetical protein
MLCAARARLGRIGDSVGVIAVTIWSANNLITNLSASAHCLENTAASYCAPAAGNRTAWESALKMSASVYRAQPVPYDWVPVGTPHSQQAVSPPDPGAFRVPVAR